MIPFSHQVLHHFQTKDTLQKPLLIICNQQKEADELKFNLDFFQTQGIDIHVFPDWETLAYDQFSPHQDIISERLSLLYDLSHDKPMVIIISLNTLLHRLPPHSFLNQHVFKIKKGELLALTKFKQNLIDAQYQHVSVVQGHGEFNPKGSLLDVYPMGSERPIRVEWFDNEIESLRYFDIQTQLSKEKVDEINILPAKEFSLNEDSVREFRQRFRELFPGNPNHCPVYEHVSNQKPMQGLEYYLPLFFENTVTLFDYLGPQFEILFDDSLKEQAKKLWQEIDIRYEQRRHDLTRPILPPSQLFISPTELEQQLHQKKCYTLIAQTSTSDVNVQIKRQDIQALSALKHHISHEHKKRVLLLASSLGRREVLHDLCKTSELYPVLFDDFQSFINSDAHLGLMHGPISQAFYFETLNILCITEYEIFGEQIVFQRQRKTKRQINTQEKYIKDLSELSMGMPVVHLDYGVGRYQGLQRFSHLGIDNEFLVISYAQADKIYVPITKLNLISKYSAHDSDHAPLHKLGHEAWQKEKKKAALKVHDMAVELLETQAKRQAQAGFSYQLDLPLYERFCSSFRFNETEDQLQSINAILKDLQAPQPMDRLVCGDVGFGKTEVAMRAAFVVVQNLRQVCVLVPTTLLAKQHYETFVERFADFPIKVELISRFRTKKESENILEGLKDAKVDILIGTHKLLQQDVHFHDLGLLIIDEEHRFGVKQKEYLKKIKHQADILSLTATPIPRTLNLAMHGMRDISIISTPPAKRLAIKTFWNEKSPGLIREAILREILRGGQVFYLHNEISSIERLRNEIRSLVPEASVEFAHGQMNERLLENIMADFYHQRFNVLVCTTIIETGIDIPTANTIIIEGADSLGLAQLHQLRGRVGRSHHQAYAYLLTPAADLITSDAKKRLEAIVGLEDLGVGFTLAMHDMEIRGAGEFLGEEQSGNLHAIGLSLYMDMLEQAIDDIKSGKIPHFDKLKQKQCELDLKISAIIPEDYLSDVNERLVIYKRISHTKNEQELHDLQVELVDRFGLFPEPLKNLIASTLVRMQAEEIGVKRIVINQEQGIIEFGEEPKIDAMTIIQLIQQEPQTYQLKNQQQLYFKLDGKLKAIEKIQSIGDLLQKVSIRH
ncbi:MAG: transcription-repair coupling factor [Gammaproteobacteria bacterium]|nr:transcription-repair coupling factor [Gammaproteobacteria bacterium]